MSHTIIIDESNGNGLLNVLPSSTNALVPSLSNEDLSQSLSEYTDADESMSAPTEFLAEFLSAVMLKDYKKALKYCKLILQFEPNNITAREFYPLIIEKLKRIENPTTSDSDENDNTPSPELDCDIENGAGINEGSLSSNGLDSDYSNSSDSDEKDLDVSNSNTSNKCSTSGGSDNTTHSYSSLLLEDDDDIQPNCGGGGGYDEKPPSNVKLTDFKDVFNGNNGNYKSQSCSDSESPTEPLTQKIAAILRAKSILPPEP